MSRLNLICKEYEYFAYYSSKLLIVNYQFLLLAIAYANLQNLPTACISKGVYLLIISIKEWYGNIAKITEMVKTWQKLVQLSSNLIEIIETNIFWKFENNLSWWPPFHLFASEKIQTSFSSTANPVFKHYFPSMDDMRGWIKRIKRNRT